jgi:hypothetical protein
MLPSSHVVFSEDYEFEFLKFNLDNVDVSGYEMLTDADPTIGTIGTIEGDIYVENDGYVLEIEMADLRESDIDKKDGLVVGQTFTRSDTVSKVLNGKPFCLKVDVRQGVAEVAGIAFTDPYADCSTATY